MDGERAGPAGDSRVTTHPLAKSRIHMVGLAV